MKSILKYIDDSYVVINNHMYRVGDRFIYLHKHVWEFVYIDTTLIQYKCVDSSDPNNIGDILEKSGRSFSPSWNDIKPVK